MEILYFLAEDETYMYKWQEVHIFDEFRHHGIQITLFNPLKYESYDKANVALLKSIKNNKYDLFMSAHTSHDLYGDTLVEIGKVGVPRLLLLFDNLLTSYRHLEASKYYDLAMLFNKDNNPIYKKYGCKCITSGYAANPYFFTNRWIKEIHRTCFVGTPYGTRSIPINMLVNNNINIDVYGKPIEGNTQPGRQLSIKEKIETAYKLLNNKASRKVLLAAVKCYVKPNEKLNINSQYLHLNESINLDDMNEVYSNYSLSLSYPACRNTGALSNPLNLVHLRNFEIPMCYGLQISTYHGELAECFEEGKEIVFYANENDFRDKVKYYTNVKHELEVKKMKMAARKRAEMEYTWFKRFKPVFNEMGIRVIE